MRLLLTTLNAKFIHINLAIRLLYQYNKAHEGLAWREFTIKEDKDDIAKNCLDYDVVAFSCYIWNITQTLEVARKIKALNPQIKILLGGPEVSYDWSEHIAREEVDYIITGEGEIPFQEFLASYPNTTHVKDLVQKVGGEVLYFQQGTIFDLNNYAHLNPYIDDDDAELRNKVVYIETSRGCPYKCEFCLASLDNKVRYLPFDTIQSNLFYVMQRARTIKFLDRTFNVKKDFTISMFSYILEHRKPETVFQFEITADIVHPDIVKYIQEHVPAGVFRFEIGIQTVNQKANLQVSRKQDFDKTSAVIKSLENKIEMHLDLIVGLPLDEWADVKYSIEEVFKLYPPELQLGFLKFLKGTPVREKYESHGYVFDAAPPYQIIESKYLSKDELLQITYLEEALEIYWNKKRAFNTLKYIAENHSIFDFLLGLGKYFHTHYHFHKHTTDDIYDALHQYVTLNFKEDSLLAELVALDYYLHFKIKPKSRFIEDLTQKEKHTIIEQKGLDYQKYRYIMLPVSFNYNELHSNTQLQRAPQNLILQYNGVDMAKVVIQDSPHHFTV